MIIDGLDGGSSGRVGVYQRQQSNSDALCLDDNDGPTRKGFVKLVEIFKEASRLFVRSVLLAAEQHDARQRVLAKSEEIAEISVGGNDDARFRTSEAQEFRIGCTAAAKVGDDVDCVMTSHT